MLDLKNNFCGRSRCSKKWLEIQMVKITMELGIVKMLWHRREYLKHCCLGIKIEIVWIKARWKYGHRQNHNYKRGLPRSEKHCHYMMAGKYLQRHEFILINLIIPFPGLYPLCKWAIHEFIISLWSSFHLTWKIP